MVIARFHSESGIDYNMYLHEDRVSALSPQELGIRIPFEYRQAEGEPGVLKWDLSYLYAELWMPQERGPQIAGAVPSGVLHAGLQAGLH